MTREAPRLEALCVVALMVAANGAAAQPVEGPDEPATPEAPAPPRSGDESPELRDLRLVEEELFGPVPDMRASGDPEIRGAVAVPSALTSRTTEPPPRVSTGGRDLSWLEGIALPRLPLRWDERVVRYLELFREDPRGRSLMRAWYRRSGRYGPMIRETLREAGLPEDLQCVAMAESGFDPTARSHAGAVGMWQFVGPTGEELGLEQNRWIDERQDPQRATRAAARYLGYLYEQLGSWELALAAYNMGYGAMLRSVRKYNTNDYWLLSHIEAGLPFETTIYVAKILACAVAMRNPERFGLNEVALEEAVELETVPVPGGMGLRRLSRLAGVEHETLDALNPELLRGRTPPGREHYSLRIPASASERLLRALHRIRPSGDAYATHVVRFGEDLGDVAHIYRTSRRRLREINGLEDDESVGPGTALQVPAEEPRERTLEEEDRVVAVPDRDFTYPGRRRVFYRTSTGDTIHEIARFFRVGVDAIREWNNIDPSGRLPPGLLIQLFVPEEVDLGRALVLTPDEVRILVVGSEPFFAYHEEQRGRVRFRYTIRPGDTLSGLASRFGLEVADLSRINGISRRTTLRAGEEIIIYTEVERAPASARPDTLARTSTGETLDGDARAADEAPESP